MLLATIGLVLLSFSGLSISTGAVLTLRAALLFAIQIVGLSLWTEPAKAYGMAVVQLAVVTVMSGIATPFESGAKVPPTPQVWVALLYLAVFATSVAFVIQSWGQAHVAPTQAAVILTMEPVFAGLFGFLAGEPLTLRIVLGGSACSPRCIWWNSVRAAPARPHWPGWSCESRYSGGPSSGRSWYE